MRRQWRDGIAFEPLLLGLIVTLNTLEVGAFGTWRPGNAQVLPAMVQVRFLQRVLGIEDTEERGGSKRKNRVKPTRDCIQ